MAKVIAGGYASGIFRKCSARDTMRTLDAKAAEPYGVTAYEDLIDELRVDISVEDGDSVQCGSLEVRAIALPGHTKCSVGYYLPAHKLLLGVETLGVYFGERTYLPSFLVGYEMTLRSFQRVRQLGAEKILLPHYGVVGQEEMEAYLTCSEQVTRDTAGQIIQMLRAGSTVDEILEYFQKRDYKPHVSPIYPIDAYRLNTGIMIGQVRKELM